MPIIPRSVLREILDNLPSPDGNDEHLLFLACIRLLVCPPEDDCAFSQEYLASKMVFMYMEAAGIQSLRLVQALLFLLVPHLQSYNRITNSR